MQDIVNKFTTHLKHVLTRALCFAVEEGRTEVLPEHLLWGITTQGGCLAAELLRKHGVTETTLEPFLASLPGRSTEPTPTSPVLSDTAKRLIERAVFLAHEQRHRYVGTEHLLQTILLFETPALRQFWKTANVNIPSLREQLTLALQGTARFKEVEAFLSDEQATPSSPLSPMENALDEEEDLQEEESEEPGTPALDFFTRDLTKPEVAAALDPVIGRDEEIERVMELLSRRTKNNPLLIGEPGVGKTAIVEGLAKRIVEEAVPSVLLGKRILALDLAGLLAGTMYRGEFEGRMKQLIEEVRSHPEVILFIDEIHMIMGAGSAGGSMDAANLLKPALARGELRCIGATTPAEYKKHMESDAALERRFGRLLIEEPNEATTRKILEGIVPFYEQHHRVTILSESIDTAVRLAERHMPERFFPDKAIDLIDEASAALTVRSSHHEEPTRQTHTLETALKHVTQHKRQAITEERYDDAMLLKEEEQRLTRELEIVRNTISKEPIGTVTPADIVQAASRTTGIPLSTLANEERDRLKHLAATLKTRVVGQDHVVDQVASSLLRAKVGIATPGRPEASFLFVGPSGVGKTALAHALATELFPSQKRLIHLDMSEYAEGYTVSKLIGSPAGYVGYRERSALTDRVRTLPASVVVFDEIEKAHPDVQALLLQILETGNLTDATGRSIPFRNNVIVLTTNVGKERFSGNHLGFHHETSSHTRTEAISDDLKQHFRPELLNRLDHILFFNELTTEAFTTITQEHLTTLQSRLAERHVTLLIDEDVVHHIATHLKEPSVGGRAVRRFIETHIESAIAQKLLHPHPPNTLRLKRHGTSVRITKA